MISVYLRDSDDSAMTQSGMRPSTGDDSMCSCIRLPSRLLLVQVAGSVPDMPVFLTIRTFRRCSFIAKAFRKTLTSPAECKHVTTDTGAAPDGSCNDNVNLRASQVQVLTLMTRL